MKALVFVLALIGTSGVARSDERTVVVPKDDKPFAVQKSDFVRLIGRGIAGSRIEVKIDGPAKLESISIVRELRDGRPLIGNVTKEIDLKPTDTGKVSVTVTVKPPQPDAKATATTYTFEVK